MEEEEDEMKEYVVTFVGTCKVYARNEHEAEQKGYEKGMDSYKVQCVEEM